MYILIYIYTSVRGPMPVLIKRLLLQGIGRSSSNYEFKRYGGLQVPKAKNDKT